MDSNYKMTQTDIHEFAIHDKPGGALRATISREPDGRWATALPGEPAAAAPDAGAMPEPQSSAQAAFNAFVQSVSPETPDTDGAAG